MHHLVTITLSLSMFGIFSVGVVRAKEGATTTTPAPRDAGWRKRHEQINALAKQGDVELLFLGDSITQGWNNNATWKKFYVDRKPLNAGIGGDRTQHVLWRIENGNVDGIAPKLAVVMIGTNNSGDDSAEDIAAGIKAIVERLRAKLPQTKVLLLGIFPRGAKPDDARREVTIKANELVRTTADDENVFYLDIGDKFLEPDGTISTEIMPDHLHLSPQGYEIWARAMEPKVAALLGDTPKE